MKQANGQLQNNNKEIEPTKYCEGCDETLPISSFHKNGKSIHPDCKDCRQKKRKNIRYPRKEGTKQCPGCGIEYPTAEFNTDQSQTDGLQSSCKTCKYKKRLIYLSTYDGFTKCLFKDLRSNAKARNISVNIKLEDIQELYIKQNGKCAITNIKMTHQATERAKDSQHILNKWNISVDRINSSKPYTINNIQLVCAIINRMKTILSNDNFLSVCSAVTQKNFNTINKLKLLSIDSTFNYNCPINKTNSLITNLIDDMQNKQITKLDNSMQKWSCSFNGYIKKLYLNIKHNLKKRAKNLSFKITEDDIKDLYIKQEGQCSISGIKMTYIGYQGADHTKINNWNISVDRINSSKGYTKDNIQLICVIINRMKTDLTSSELLLLCDNVNKINFDKINEIILKKIKTT